MVRAATAPLLFPNSSSLSSPSYVSSRLPPPPPPVETSSQEERWWEVKSPIRTSPTILSQALVGNFVIALADDDQAWVLKVLKPRDGVLTFWHYGPPTPTITRVFKQKWFPRYVDMFDGRPIDCSQALAARYPSYRKFLWWFADNRRIISRPFQLHRAMVPLTAMDWR